VGSQSGFTCPVLHAVYQFFGLQYESPENGVFWDSAGDLRESSAEKRERQSLETLADVRVAGRNC